MNEPARPPSTRARAKHAAKLTVQKAVSLVPASAGFRLNEWIVGRVRSAPGDDFFRFRIEKGLANVALISSQGTPEDSAAQEESARPGRGASEERPRARERAGTPIEGEVLELGTGWHLTDPILFFALGADRVHTVDHHRHINLGYAKRICALVGDPDVIASLEIDPAVRAQLVPERLATIRAAADSGSLDELLERLRVHFVLRPSCTLRPGDVRGPISLLYSESVLQRIPTRELTRNIAYISAELLAPGGTSFHRTDQKDINAQEHVNGGLDPLAYLRHSDFVHDRVLSCRFNAQNRLRESDFVRLFESAGLETVHVESFVEDSDVERYRHFPFTKRFEGHDLRDLVTKASIIIGRRPLRERTLEPAPRAALSARPTVAARTAGHPG